MSELGITVYSVLLVWMRAVNDWFWSVLSGGGHGLYTLVLSHWKTWLVVLVAAGLIADWLVWMVRWRPLRLIFGKRVRASELLAGWTGETDKMGQKMKKVEKRC